MGANDGLILKFTIILKSKQSQLDKNFVHSQKKQNMGDQVNSIKSSQIMMTRFFEH